MSVNIDEAGRDEATHGIHLAPARRQTAADCRDNAPRHCHVRHDRIPAVTISNEPVADYQIEHAPSSRRRSLRASSARHR
jgi:hypothetical protein